MCALLLTGLSHLILGVEMAQTAWDEDEGMGMDGEGEAEEEEDDD